MRIASVPALGHLQRMIRPARPDELPRLAEIEEAAEQLFAGTAMDFVLRLPRAPVATDIPAGVLIWVAADADDRPVGFLEAEPRGGWLHLLEMSVDPQAQRQGHARALLETALAHARVELLPMVSLTTDKFLPFNGPMYAAMGFAVLEPSGTPGWLRDILQQEADSGFDPARRIAMARAP